MKRNERGVGTMIMASAWLPSRARVLQAAQSSGLGAAAAGLLSLCAVACQQHAKPEDSSQAGAAAPFALNSRSVYAVTLNSESALEQGRPIGLRVSGKLIVLPVSAQGNRIELSMVLTDARAEGQGEQGFEAIEPLARELGEPVFITLSGGALRETKLKRNLSAVAANIQRTIGSALQFPEPLQKAATTWKTFEWDATGKYEVEYLAKPGTNVWGKRKTRYEALVGMKTKLPPGVVLPQGPLDLVTEVVSHHGSVELDLARNPIACNYTEKLRAKVLHGAPATSTTTLSLKRVAFETGVRTPAPKLPVEQLVSLVGEDAYDAPSPVKLDGQRIAGMTFESIVAELEASERDWKPPEPAAADGKNSAADEQSRARAQRLSDLFLALGAIFREQPHSVASAKAKIRSGSPAAELLLNALGSSNARGSQEVLVGILQDMKQSEDLRTAAAASLIRSDHPSEVTEKALTRLANDDVLGRHAVYGLGTFARKLRLAREVERSNRISAFLLSRLRSVESFEHKVTVLRGIANSAYEPAIAEIKPLLSNEDPIVRSAAVEALRLMPGEEANHLVASAMSDATASVRHAAIGTASVRPLSPELIAAAQTAATSSPDGYGRMQAVQLLGRWLPQRAELRATLDAIARKDAEPKIRDAASQLISTERG